MIFVAEVNDQAEIQVKIFFHLVVGVGGGGGGGRGGGGGAAAAAGVLLLLLLRSLLQK